MKINNTIKLAAIVAIYLAATPSGYALNTQKRDINNNMTIDYKITPKAVDSLEQMLSEGVLYGRLRSNMFYWGWENEQTGSTADNSAWGLGGSLIYSTGYLNGFGATAGMYTTHTVGTDNTDSAYPGVDFGKAGKDTYSRADGSGAHIDVLALAYLEYRFAKSTIKVGRQIFEGALLRSNDTKMIPNTFEGYVLESKDIADTTFRAAYFISQKLRDHRDFHSLIAFEDAPDYAENDDIAINKGLSVANIEAVGADVNPDMIVTTLENKSIQGVKLNLDGMYIDNFVSFVIAEINYKIELGESGWSLTPGARYISQMDKGAGSIGGAALTGALAIDKTPSPDALTSYTNPNSVDGSAWMARLKLAKGAGSVIAGYSAIADEADLIAPWRGFPTGGYTRSFAQYNWEANTKSWMIKCAYDLGKANLVDGLRGSLDYASMDYDDDKIVAKTIRKTDRRIIHLDVQKTFASVPNLELMLRGAIIDADANPYDDTDYESYNDYRFEINYLF
jgi:hypothetical protein